MSMADIFAEPHFREREMIIDVPEATLGSLPQPGVVPKLSRTPGRVTHAGPPLGQDTEDILREFLQISPTDLTELRQQGVI
jgi:crotonobetainyl-CoA:carnitine CoA-transferase CaiB-like acyl-CoA transferase